ncbi:hypothetical protein [Nitrospirillum iridis]|uniref:Uncharacterized protein n=1 Tax=Nitrospirillum iridis TaxID=765888 RepID=A0A7X0EDE7_9PROT|nr:hypothetical protein [Nitrospirillum iridis]MBB6250981.1 hypothetical protein [Nitrospirillum iridis]
MTQAKALATKELSARTRSILILVRLIFIPPFMPDPPPANNLVGRRWLRQAADGPHQQCLFLASIVSIIAFIFRNLSVMRLAWRPSVCRYSLNGWRPALMMGAGDGETGDADDRSGAGE